MALVFMCAGLEKQRIEDPKLKICHWQGRSLETSLRESSANLADTEAAAS